MWQPHIPTWFISIRSIFLVLSSIQSLSRVRLFATPWIGARQASLSITDPRSSPKLTLIESAMPSSHLILCRPFLLLPPIPPSIRVFTNESALHMRWPKYWSFSFSISGWCIDLDYCDVKWFALETNRSFCQFLACTQVLHFRLFCWYEDYYISSKGFLLQ